MKKNKIVTSMIWTFGERIFAQFVTILVGIILARLLAPEIYGIISIIMIFINFCNIFVTSGFGISLVQKSDVEEIDYNTGFWLSLCFSIVIYGILFSFVPVIAKVYDNNYNLVLILRIMMLKVLISPFGTIQQAYIQRHMQFKLFFISTSVGTVISGILGIYLAYTGFGVWSLVVQYMSNSIIDTCILLIIGGWKPKCQFSLKRAKGIWEFSWKLLLSELIANLDTNIKNLFIGKYFGLVDLAYFDQGKKYTSVLVTNVNVATTKVMLPVYSRVQSDKKRLKELLRKSIRISFYILTPILIGFATVADDFVKIVLTDKWFPAVIYIQIFCVAYTTRPIENMCLQAILAIGRSDVRIIVLSLINFVSIFLTIIAIYSNAHMIYIALISLVCSILSTIIFLHYSNKLLDYSLTEQIKDIYLIIISVIIMAGIVSVIGKINLNIYYKFLLKIIVGVTVYIAVTGFLKIEGFTYIISKLNKNIENSDK